MPKVVGIKLTDADYALWSKMAEINGQTLPAWIRRVVNPHTLLLRGSSAAPPLTDVPRVVGVSQVAAGRKVNPSPPEPEKVNPGRRPNGHRDSCVCSLCELAGYFKPKPKKG